MRWKTTYEQHIKMDDLAPHQRWHDDKPHLVANALDCPAVTQYRMAGLSRFCNSRASLQSKRVNTGLKSLADVLHLTGSGAMKAAATDGGKIVWSSGLCRPLASFANILLQAMPAELR
jgi:hypothetical protein